MGGGTCHGILKTDDIATYQNGVLVADQATLAMHLRGDARHIDTPEGTVLQVEW